MTLHVLDDVRVGRYDLKIDATVFVLCVFGGDGIVSWYYRKSKLRLKVRQDVGGVSGAFIEKPKEY